MFPLKHSSAYSLLLSLRLKLLNGKKKFSQHFFTFISLLPKSILLQNLIMAILFISLSLFTLSTLVITEASQPQGTALNSILPKLIHKYFVYGIKKKRKITQISHCRIKWKKILSKSTSTITKYRRCNDTNIRKRATHCLWHLRICLFPDQAMVFGLCRIWREWLESSKTDSEDTKGSQYLISEQF